MKDPEHHFIKKAVKPLRIWFSQKKRLMAQAQDLQRQLAEAWRDKAQLEVEIEILRGRLIHTEKFGSELPLSAYLVSDLRAGVIRTWDSLTDSQKNYWIELASLREKT